MIEKTLKLMAQGRWRPQEAEARRQMAEVEGNREWQDSESRRKKIREVGSGNNCSEDRRSGR